MFERFTEEARRSLFFARFKTTERDGAAITDEDLLQGISLGAPATIELLGGGAADALRSAESGEQFWTRMQEPLEEWVAHSRKEIPFSVAATHAIEAAVAEADSLGHKEVGPEHMLLALLRDETTDAGRRLQEAGVRLFDFRLRVKAHRERGAAD